MSVEVMENVVNGGGGGEHHHHHHNHHETSNESSASSSSNGVSSSSSSGVASGSGGGGGGDSMVYDEAFPSLPSSGGVGPAAWPIGGRSVASLSSGETKLPVRKNQHTSQMIHLSPDECKSQTFGNETRKKCEEIAATLGVKVEMCMSRDQTLHINISGNEEKVLEAKRGIINELKVEVESKMKIPKEQHKFLIGKSGAILKDLQERTCTKIQVPKPDANLDLISIRGLKEDVATAIHEIQTIVDKESKQSVERLTIPKLYHPWLRGVNNEIATEISLRTGAKVNIPPPVVEKDEIVVSGEREKVEAACAEIRRIYESKQRANVKQIALQISKTQHKLIIGKNGQSVHDIFKDYDVYVQVPKLESPSETILLFGEEAKLGSALSQVIAKSNSVVSVRIDVPSWLHRHMIGEKGGNIAKITNDFPNTHVKFETDDKIAVDGPPDEVEKVRQRLEAISEGFKQVMTCEDVTIEPRFYPQLLGQKRSDAHLIARLNKEHNVIVRLPQGAETGTCSSSSVRIEGPPEAVRRCRQELLEIVAKLADERSKDIIIDQKFHPNLIGKGGKTLNEIRAKFNDVQINIPPASDKSEVVTIRGNKNDVEKCFKHLQQLIKEMQESNYREEMQIVKEFHRIIIGKGGAFIKKIRDDTATRIDIPSNDSDSNSIVITGKQENVLKARKLIEDKIKELVNIKEDHVEIPHQFHTALIGKNGSIIKQIRAECGGVIISFPPESNATNNRITLKGTAEDIQRAKQELLKVVDQRSDLGYSEEITVKLDYHKFLVGRHGNKVNSLRDKHGVRIVFPTSSSSSSENQNGEGVITIMGKKEGVKAARAELEETVKSLEEQVTVDVSVDPKWHKSFTSKRAKLINEISDENCNVKISFPKTENTSDQVTIKGPKDAVEAAKKRILEHVHRLENQVTLEVNIPQQYHAVVIGKKGVNSQKISEEFHVNIQFHAKDDSSKPNQRQGGGQNQQQKKQKGAGAAAGTNGGGENNNSHNQSQEEADTPADSSSPPSSAGTSPAKTTTNGTSPDIVLISGFKDDCEKARDALLQLVPQREDIPFPAKFHKELLAEKAKILRDLQEDHHVQVNVPKRPEKPDQPEANYVTVIGSREYIEETREALRKLADDFEERNYSVELTGGGGEGGLNLGEIISTLRMRTGNDTAEKLSKKYEVRLDFSKRDEPDRIVIRGLRAQVEKCEAYLRKRVEEEESKQSQEILIDSRVHSRIIGGQGKTLAKIQEKYKVEIKFPSRNSDVVIVKGTNADAIDDACEHLRNLEEEYLQDVIDRDRYTHPSSKSGEHGSGGPNKESKGFVVRGAPWEQSSQQQSSSKHHNGAAAAASHEPVPDTNNMDLFPTISVQDTAAAAGSGGQRAMTWGPFRK